MMKDENPGGDAETQPAPSPVDAAGDPIPDPPDFGKWLERDFWSLAEAAMLVVGIDPDKCRRPHHVYFSTRPKEDAAIQMLRAIANAVVLGILWPDCGWGRSWGAQPEISRGIDLVHVAPTEYLAWIGHARLICRRELHDAVREAVRANPKFSIRKRQLSWPAPGRIARTTDEPDYEIWASADRITLMDAVFLVHGQTPHPRRDTSCEFFRALSGWESRTNVFFASKTAIRAGEVQVLPYRRGEESPTPGSLHPNGEDHWYFEPIPLLKLVGRLAGSMPPPLRALVLRGEKPISTFDASGVSGSSPTIEPVKRPVRAEKYSSEREQVLGAAFAALAGERDGCTDSKGKVVAGKVAALLEDKETYYFGHSNGRMPLDVRTAAKLIGAWLRKAYPQETAT